MKKTYIVLIALIISSAFLAICAIYQVRHARLPEPVVMVDTVKLEQRLEALETRINVEFEAAYFFHRIYRNHILAHTNAILQLQKDVGLIMELHPKLYQEGF